MWDLISSLVVEHTKRGTPDPVVARARDFDRVPLASRVHRNAREVRLFGEAGQVRPPEREVRVGGGAGLGAVIKSGKPLDRTLLALGRTALEDHHVPLIMLRDVALRGEGVLVLELLKFNRVAVFRKQALCV